MLYILNNVSFLFMCLFILAFLASFFPQGHVKVLSSRKKNEADNPQSQQTSLDWHRGTDFLNLWTTEDINNLSFTSLESQHSKLKSQPFKKNAYLGI